MNSSDSKAREAFEAWYVEDGRRQGIEMRDGISHLREGNHYGAQRVALCAKWEGWQAALQWAASQQAAPEGWRLVPLLPSLAMMDAGWGICGGDGLPGAKPNGAKMDAAARRYQAMLAAAPAQQAAEGCTQKDTEVLRQANHGFAEENQRLRQALRFYAAREHFNLSDKDEWDTVSGEPQNWWCDSAGTATIEDGSIAVMALRGEVIQWSDEDGNGEPPVCPGEPESLIFAPPSTQGGAE